MATLDFEALSKLVASFGPTDEQRQRFGQTFFGTLLGQAVVLVGLVLIYVAALVAINRYAIEDLKALRSIFGDFWFWFAIAAPLICILLFSMVPTLWRGLRERRLKVGIIDGDLQFKAGYFRLRPYDEADREVFNRLDGAGAEILGWLRSTNASPLYLSGASGVGKTSLFAAYVLPKLRDEGWAVVETRLFGDPVERLRAALLEAEGLFPRRAAVDPSLRGLLEKAVGARKRNGLPPLLLVIDQFEEFLILHSERERAAFADFLTDLFKNPIDCLRLLLVFRSDYRSLVFKLDLPPLVAAQNWQELAPYGRGEATSFLQGGGRKLSTEAINALFRGLDQIEEARGLYRPITLNMVGLVLERMGGALEGDPARLIQSYLKECLTESQSRDFAKAVLAKMITDAGTKEPRTEAALATLTGFEAWQVRATLADLAGRGLVRRLEGAPPVWEIAHDFLARLIGQLIGRLTPSILARARPLVAPVVLLAWLALAAFALPNWQNFQRAASEHALEGVGASISNSQFGGVLVAFPQAGLVDETLSGMTADLERADTTEISITASKITSLEPLKRLAALKGLSFESDSGITSLEPLKGLANLRTLNLSGDGGITSLEPLKGLANLQMLNLSGDGGITSLEPLKGLANLQTLNLAADVGITSLEPLKGLASLQTLDLSNIGGIASLEPLLYNNVGITSLEPLKGLANLRALHLAFDAKIKSLEPLMGLANLQMLELTFDSNIKSLEPLKGLANLQTLDLSFDSGITSLEPLEGLANLRRLILSSDSAITSLEPLGGLANLQTLNLSGDGGITSLEPLKGLANLRTLDLSGDGGIKSLEPLKGLANLQTLNLIADGGITSLEPLRGLANLRTLDLSGDGGITSLEPLDKKRIEIIGASAEQLATMQ